MATVGEIQTLLERWAPREFAMEGDNPGLQCGDARTRVRGILLTLDATEAAVREADRKRANMLIAHHPLLFTPLRRVDLQEKAGKIIDLLIRRKMSLVAAHTNLDFAREGTSFALARRIGLGHIRFLHSPMKILTKVVTFVPRDSVDRVAGAMAAAGAGSIGNYDSCSFRTAGTGTFRGNARAHPAVGTRGTLERIDEVRLEMLVPEYRLAEVLTAMRREHPYEEVAHDVYSLENQMPDAGMGAVGSLPHPLRLNAFLAMVKKRLNIPMLRCSTSDRRLVRNVAVCGGSGARLLEAAEGQNADVFITADIKYHSFHDAGNRIVLVDAGHFETEYPVLPAVARYLRESIGSAARHLPITLARRSRNPVLYV
jgi:dinuclear metal center YbgI/SA1388 family protein